MILIFSKKVVSSKRGSAFLENGLWIALCVLALVPAIIGLASAISDSMQGMIGRIEEVGTP